MKVKMLSAVAGPNGGASAGDEIDVSKETGKAWIAGGYASAVETAAHAGAPETATAPGGTDADKEAKQLAKNAKARAAAAKRRAAKKGAGK